jgi:hypothetical protein
MVFAFCLFSLRQSIVLQLLISKTIRRLLSRYIVAGRKTKDLPSSLKYGVCTVCCSSSCFFYNQKPYLTFRGNATSFTFPNHPVRRRRHKLGPFDNNAESICIAPPNYMYRDVLKSSIIWPKVDQSEVMLGKYEGNTKQVAFLASCSFR